MNLKNKTAQMDIIIAGGGIAGLTLALLLGRAGLDVALIENHPPRPVEETQASARTVALMNSSLNIIKATGMWESIAQFSCPMQTMKIIDASIANAKTIEKIFNADMIGTPQFGFNISNSLLRAALFEALQKTASITRYIPAAFARYVIEGTRISVQLDNGVNIHASLLVGADGRNSSVRKSAGINARTQDYGQSAQTCLIEHTKPHHNTSTEFHRAGGPFALVPLPGRTSSVVWVEKTARAHDLMTWDKTDLEKALQQETHGTLGAITLRSKVESWPLSSLKADSMIAPRIALMAEAAHVMSPITAQGLNLSLRDTAALAETIIDAMRLGLDLGSDPILQNYKRRRALDVSTRTFGVDAMNRIVSQELDLFKNIRRAGLNAVTALSPLKRIAMQQGLAPPIDHGRLAKGEAL